MKEKAYLVCDFREGDVDCGALNVGVEFMGNCHGRVLTEDGTKIGQHYSSSIGWLRIDLTRNIDLDIYDIIDLLDQPVPENFK